MSFLRVESQRSISPVLHLQNGEAQDEFYIELDFPVDPVTEFRFDESASQLSGALNGASIIDLKRTQIRDDLLVVVTSGKAVSELQPKLDAIVKCPERGDPVCGSAHCALASYWSKKLGKCDFNAYQASPRGGVLNIHLDEQIQ
ncbi:hypothetical protein JHK87_034187 [Glycine soja]|nr:hypothetical protein JHK87_034187 [Glycine soja]